MKKPKTLLPTITITLRSHSGIATVGGLSIVYRSYRAWPFSMFAAAWVPPPFQLPNASVQQDMLSLSSPTISVDTWVTQALVTCHTYQICSQQRLIFRFLRLSQIAALLGMTESRICQIRGQAVATLLKYLPRLLARTSRIHVDPDEGCIGFFESNPADLIRPTLR